MWDYNHLEERDNWENTVVLLAEDQETVSVAAELDLEFLSFFFATEIPEIVSTTRYSPII